MTNFPHKDMEQSFYEDLATWPGMTRGGSSPSLPPC
jgi:hypothetical protein